MLESRFFMHGNMRSMCAFAHGHVCVCMISVLSYLHCIRHDDFSAEHTDWYVKEFPEMVCPGFLKVSLIVFYDAHAECGIL